MKTLKTTLTNLIIYPKAYPKFLKVILLLICILFFDNCRRRDECEGSPNSNYNYDSTHFDSSEQAKIPDWQGDSLYFYSDVGDTAYMYCDWQSSPNRYEYDKGGAYLPCPYDLWSWHPSVYYYYHSNEPSLNGLEIHIYKESNAKKWEPNGPPQSWIVIRQFASQFLSNIGGNNLPNDSVILINGFVEKGWTTFTKTASLNLNVGIIKLNPEIGKKWTLFNYKLNN
jgi:hypothetical protein